MDKFEEKIKEALHEVTNGFEVSDIGFLNNIQDEIYLDNGDILKHRLMYGYQP